MTWPLVLMIGLIAAAAVHGWISGRARLLSEERRKLNEEIQTRLHDCDQQIVTKKRKLEAQVETARKELKERTELVGNLRREFSNGYIKGREWLAAFIADADRALDDQIVLTLKHKKRPAPKASQEVAKARAERRAYKERAKFLEYQLKSYEEYFPALLDYRELILDEAVSLSVNADNVQALDDIDPVLRFLPKSECDQFTTTERNQRALDCYLTRTLNELQIGRFYERYVGYLYEQDGWNVEYYGIMQGFEDLGRDLICKRGDEVVIVQTKCWSKNKVIHEKHIFQLFGTTQHFLMNATDRLFPPEATACFYTTTELTPVARTAAEYLKITVKERFPLDKSYPMIKCNSNQATKQRIYHLPFDQQFDTAKIIPDLGECYVQSVDEAESLGFRRAWRHHRPNTS